MASSSHRYAKQSMRSALHLFEPLTHTRRRRHHGLFEIVEGSQTEGRRERRERERRERGEREERERGPLIKVLVVVATRERRLEASLA